MDKTREKRAQGNEIDYFCPEACKKLRIFMFSITIVVVIKNGNCAGEAHKESDRKY